MKDSSQPQGLKASVISLLEQTECTCLRQGGILFCGSHEWQTEAELLAYLVGRADEADEV